ncbi:hypothetical protein Q2T46_14405 [Thermoanaerobacterium sp. CMT5567-10]|uniref:hypothetical protein n=1 Tax=Thermoanaerobacterium sp. CMT5567-10 TaxID=3061989 RepID=UPI0026DFEE4F|nr:hypothetical protein [Thermoanaerobacterium sp. CMT5567-10]WKV08696.1 hypothetical protein Q2T46_14405 [Thermoanaerobacterium sp. CMT5567-10]
MRHRDFNIYAMTADSGFDDVLNYKYLFENHGILPVIALNPRNTRKNFGKSGINEDGIPTYQGPISSNEMGWLL